MATIKRPGITGGLDSPDGLNAAWKIKPNGPAGQAFLGQNISVRGCVSVLFKDAELRYGVIFCGADAYAVFDLNTAAVAVAPSASGSSAGIVPIGGGWHLCWVSGTPSGSHTIAGFTGSSAANLTASPATGAGVLAFLPQFEAGATVPTSRIPTQTSAVTRAADIVPSGMDDPNVYWGGVPVEWSNT